MKPEPTALIKRRLLRLQEIAKAADEIGRRYDGQDDKT